MAYLTRRAKNDLDLNCLFCLTLRAHILQKMLETLAGKKGVCNLRMSLHLSSSPLL